MSKVFVLQQSKGLRDFTQAYRFGDIEFIVNRDVFEDEADQRVNSLNKILSEALSRFDPSSDYILLTGDPIVIMLTGLLIGSIGSPHKVKCLKWDSFKRDYFVVEL